MSGIIVDCYRFWNLFCFSFSPFRGNAAPFIKSLLKQSVNCKAQFHYPAEGFRFNCLREIISTNNKKKTTFCTLVNYLFSEIDASIQNVLTWNVIRRISFENILQTHSLSAECSIVHFRNVLENTFFFSHCRYSNTSIRIIKLKTMTTKTILLSSRLIHH